MKKQLIINLEKLERFIAKQKVAFICSVDNDGFPNLKAMLPPRKREVLKLQDCLHQLGNELSTARF
jgi:general stress protein 26